MYDPEWMDIHNTVYSLSLSLFIPGTSSMMGFNTHLKSAVRRLLGYFITHQSLVSLEATVLAVSLHDGAPPGRVDKKGEGSKWFLTKIEIQICY